MTTRAGSDIVIIGGGLAGLTAAAILARAGRSVTVFEKSHVIGGRASTQQENGYVFNLGPHALYRQGQAARVFAELGVHYTGGTPSASGGYAIRGNAKHALPGGLMSLLTTSLFGVWGKIETARLLSAVAKIPTEPLQRVAVRQWLDAEIRDAELRMLVEALLRLTTYANAPDRMSAGSALQQLQLALTGNVLYLDGGWSRLALGLEEAARTSGAQLLTQRRAVAVRIDGVSRQVELADGTRHAASAVILATSPAVAVELLGNESNGLRGWTQGATPVRAACLDVGLSRLPRPGARFALGIDQPLYLSVHSAVAKLAPEGGATVQVAKYLGADESEARADERELESLLDIVQPGWREALVTRRFLPRLIVSNALVAAAGGGTAGRPSPAVAGVDHVYVAGDWVGPEGMLADAAVASAERAAKMILSSANQKWSPGWEARDSETGFLHHEAHER